MSVVGFDVGSLQSVIAVARNRGIDIITNEVSNRATPSMVSFGPKQRYLGESAKNQEMSNFKNTVRSLKRIIGHTYKEVSEMPFEPEEVGGTLCDVDGEAGVEVNYLGETTKFSATQLLAMYFGHLRDITSNNKVADMSDVVISVPGWFTDRQRRAVLQASKIANLNCLRLINDNAAAALGYGITKTDLPEDKPRNVVFADMGHASFSVAVVAFKRGEMKILSAAYEPDCGGRNFDRVLLDHFVKLFDEKYNINIRSKTKALLRLRTACEKLKKVLSANTQAPINVENLMSDIDASAMISREEFEELINETLQKLRAPIEKALKASGLSVEEIDSVEAVGGSIRVPAVKAKLAEFFGRDLSYTLNQDEAVARGCALQCAILSPSFRVRDFSVNDVNAYPIKFQWQPVGEAGANDTNLGVFGTFNPIPNTKLLTFYRKEPFTVESVYSQPEDLPAGTNPWIARFDVKDVQPDPSGDLSTIKVKARLDINGILNITSAYTVEEVEVEEPIPTPEGSEKKEGSETPAEGQENGTPEKPATRKVKKLVKKGNLPISQASLCLDDATVAAFTKKESEMKAHDILVLATEHTKNSLEEYIYHIRDQVSYTASDFVNPAEKDAYLSKLTEIEDWLYDDGDDASKAEYEAKLADLKGTGDPIVERYKESEKRPEAARELRQNLTQWAELATSNDERFAHITEEDKQKVVERCESTQQWLDEKLSKQEGRAKHDAPVVFSHEILQKKQELISFATPIMNKPKPQPKPEETKPEEKDDAKAQNGETETPKSQDSAANEQSNEMDVD
ncbi:adenyl-nucleotide exchange factor sse1 [Mycoemilia scoparia]|uniref:Adenyl-nucleotide exchange factor sse1 n=1 Tax=Mycoemilia scoparia TaxID=417184 RepID=A0A9W8A2S7_9FUNG|nr:adenyl-nucleotide exchange factor sse1 [Mycoemilia scoparia]